MYIYICTVAYFVGCVLGFLLTTEYASVNVLWVNRRFAKIMGQGNLSISSDTGFTVQGLCGVASRTKTPEISKPYRAKGRECKIKLLPGCGPSLRVF